eukprot:2486473-Pyramimonas_sp.AAC.1
MPGMSRRKVFVDIGVVVLDEVLVVHVPGHWSCQRSDGRNCTKAMMLRAVGQGRRRRRVETIAVAAKRNMAAVVGAGATLLRYQLQMRT